MCVCVISKQQLGDEFVNGLRVCQKTPQIEQTPICSETDADAVWLVLFCLMEQDAEEDGEQGGCQDAPLLDAVGDGRLGIRPTVTHCALPDLTDLHGDGGGG